MKTHYQRCALERITACGLKDQRLSTDPAQVDCARCRRSYQYLIDVDWDLPPYPVRHSARDTIRKRLTKGAATARELAVIARVTDRRVRQILVEDGAKKERHSHDRCQIVWRKPKGGWPCR